MKKKLLLFGCSLSLFVVLIVSNISVAGKKHVDVVEENITLANENSQLKQENGHLKLDHELSKEETNSIIDSLAKSIEQKHEEIIATENEVKRLKNVITHEKVNSVTSSINTSPYQLESISLPGTEDNN